MAHRGGKLPSALEISNRRAQSKGKAQGRDRERYQQFCSLCHAQVSRDCNGRYNNSNCGRNWLSCGSIGIESIFLLVVEASGTVVNRGEGRVE